MKTIFETLILIIIVWPSIAWADSAPVARSGVDGSDVVLIKNDRVRMLREVVNIDCAWTTYTVVADFWFKNTTAQQQEVQFGFPIDFVPREDDFPWGVELQEISKSFRVEWKDTPVSYTLGKLQPKESSREKRQWICWGATFAPHEEVHHRIGYTFPTSRFSGGGGDWQMEEPYARLTYVLKTGSAWQGPIESAIVNIHYDHPIPRFFGGYDSIWRPEPSELTIAPKGYSWDKEKKTITWKFKNFVPGEDIRFGWEPPHRLDEFHKMIIGKLLFMLALIVTTAVAIVYVYKRVQKRRRLKASAQPSSLRSI